MPDIPDGLTECQQRRVRAFLRDVLARMSAARAAIPHLRRHDDAPDRLHRLRSQRASGAPAGDPRHRGGETAHRLRRAVGGYRSIQPTDRPRMRRLNVLVRKHRLRTGYSSVWTRTMTATFKLWSKPPGNGAHRCRRRVRGSWPQVQYAPARTGNNSRPATSLRPFSLFVFKSVSRLGCTRLGSPGIFAVHDANHHARLLVCSVRASAMRSVIGRVFAATICVSG
jgi:hypothetical protein